MKLCVELFRLKNGEVDEVLITCDQEGLTELLRKLQHLKGVKDHVHLMTPSWAGYELTEDKSNVDSELVNHVGIVTIDG